MMLAQQQLQSRAAFAPARRAGSTSRRPAAGVVCLAGKRDDLRTAVLSAAVATSLILSSPAPSLAAAPAPERRSFGAERTAKLIDEAGTPDAVRPDSMKTNVPFQAPGINAPPRGKGQEQGTSPKEVAKNVKKVIKEQTFDPDSTPLGISKGPLVKQAKKMDQPGNLRNIKRETKEAVGRAKEAARNSNPGIKAAENDPDRSKKSGIISGGFTTMFGVRQPSQGQ